MVGTEVAKVSDSGYILKTEPAALASGLMAAKYLGNWELAFSVMGKTGSSRFGTGGSKRAVGTY